MSTIKMPGPVVIRTIMPEDYRYGHVYGYTAQQMEAYAAAKVRESQQAIYGEAYLAGWNAATEKAADIAKAVSDKYAYGHYGNEVDTADEIEAAIRDQIQGKS